MTDDQIIALPPYEKAERIRKLFGTREGKLCLQIIKIHFKCHLPSAAVAEFDTNQTFYQDGMKAVPALIDQILGGLWSKPEKTEEQTQQEL